jgi:uncharacterized protein YjdB
MIKRRFTFMVVLISLFLLGIFSSVTVFAQINNAAIERLTGKNVYESSINISKAGWVKATTIIIASGVDYSGAILSAPLSKLKDAPILLAGKGELDAVAVNEIKRLKATQAFIIGSAGIISTGVDKQLKGLKLDVTRINGVDNYDISKKIAEMTGFKNGIIVTGNLDFPDMISSAPIAGIKSMPILISTKNALNQKISAFIKDKSIPVSYIVGGSNVLNSSIQTMVPNSRRLSGADIYANNLSIINQFAGALNFDKIFLISGKDFTYSASSFALAAKNKAPIFLTDKNTISKATIDFIKSKKVKHVIILGGVETVSAGVEKTVKEAIESAEIHVASVAFNKNISTLVVGGADTLSVSVKPVNALNKAVVYASSNKNIIEVDNSGRVRALSTGAAIIVAVTVDGNFTTSSAITVTNPVVKVNSISLNKNQDTLEVNGIDVLSLMITPDNATNKDIAWTSSNNDVAMVDNMGTVRAVSTGSAIITAAADGGLTTSCAITVNNTEVPITSISLDKTYDTLEVGETDILSTSISPDNATKKYLIWTSSDNEIAAVDNLGNIRAVSTGAAIITVTDPLGNYSASCALTVVPAQPVIVIPIIPRPKLPLTIAIDIGHNAKYDTGAVGIRSEDACTKEVGTLVIAKLKALGYKVIDCSPKNTKSQTDALKQRVDIANAAHADLFMSIHFNVFNKIVNGSEIYMGSNKIKTKAQKVLNNLVSLGYANRGLFDNSRGLYVLKNTTMPAMLVECSFLDSVVDMNRYDPEAIANALVNGLIADN